MAAMYISELAISHLLCRFEILMLKRNPPGSAWILGPSCFMCIYVHIYTNTHTHTHIYIYMHTYICMHLSLELFLSVSIVLLLSTTGPRPERSPCPRRGGSSAAPGCEGPKAHTSTGLFENVGRKAEV